jgi:hypothetical protein
LRHLLWLPAALLRHLLWLPAAACLLLEPLLMLHVLLLHLLVLCPRWPSCRVSGLGFRV